MRDGLDAAAGEVLVPHAGRGDVVEGVAHALGRDVDVSLGAQGRGGDPEHFLLQHPWDELGRYGLVELAHRELLAERAHWGGQGADKRKGVLRLPQSEGSHEMELESDSTPRKPATTQRCGQCMVYLSASAEGHLSSQHVV